MCFSKSWDILIKKNYFENGKKKNPTAQEEITVKSKYIRDHIPVD